MPEKYLPDHLINVSVSQDSSKDKCLRVQDTKGYKLPEPALGNAETTVVCLAYRVGLVV